ncbi:hypothetical protein [Hymenobacter crusticola]|uniref:Uncharacterized protein n=1 Tax=Hymenobacter crusticola TaxID=1770526 RepID=A0A243W973_9BACT|nr:hypothetical protein [Hymenobacter crusticola]OUJ71764.1 hypothetical protein BXP70_20615 [Hymenobacter crusticola]
MQTIACSCTLLIDNYLPSLFKGTKKAFCVPLNKLIIHESSVGPTQYLLLFEGQTTVDQLKLAGFSGNHTPEELDIDLVGADKQQRLFCTVVDQ